MWIILIIFNVILGFRALISSRGALYIKAELKSKQMDVANFIPLFSDGNGSYSLCTDYFNEYFADYFLKYSYKISNPEILEFKLYTPHHIEKINEPVNYYNGNHSTPVGSVIKYGTNQWISAVIFIPGFKARFSIVEDVPDIFIDGPENEKGLLVRKIYSPSDVTCGAKSYDQLNVFRTRREVKRLGFDSIRCNDTFVTSTRKVFDVVNNNPKRSELIGVLVNTGNESCHGPRVTTGVEGENFLAFYTDKCFHEEDFFLDLTHPTDLVNAKQCPVLKVDLFGSEICTNLIYSEWMTSEVCMPQACDVLKFIHMLFKKQISFQDCNCAQKNYIGQDSALVSIFNDPTCSGPKPSFMIYKAPMNGPSGCIRDEFLGKGFSERYTCVDEKYIVNKRGIPLLFPHPSCELDEDGYNALIKEGFMRQDRTKLSPMFAQDPLQNCFPLAVGEFSFFFVPADNATRSISLLCDSDNQPVLREYRSDECVNYMFRETVGSVNGLPPLCMASKDGYFNKVGLGKFLMLCSPNMCFGKNEYETGRVCSGHGKCVDFDVCACAWWLGWYGKECKSPLWSIVFILGAIMCCFCGCLVVCSCCCLILICYSLKFTKFMVKIFLKSKTDSITTLTTKPTQEHQENTPLLLFSTGEGPNYNMMIKEDDAIRFEGDENGEGRIYKNDKISFEGTFRNGVKEGKGKEYNHILVEEEEENFETFEDDFTFPKIAKKKKKKKRKKPKNKKKKKIERMTVLFEGVYQDDVRHGRGIEYSNLYGKRLEGIWRNGEIVAIERDYVDLPKIRISDFQFDFVKDKIGSGSEGDVFRVKYKGRDAALKILKMEDIIGSNNNLEVLINIGKQTQRLVRSQKIWSKVSHHPFILDLYAWTGVNNKVPTVKGYITELCEESLAHSILRNSIKLWSDKVRILYEIAVGMQFLHSLSVMHRDLKTANVLLDFRRSVKICDFEFSRYDEMDWKSMGDVSVLGSPQALAPEVIRRGNNAAYTKSCDVYSYGILVFCVFYGVNNPYGHMKRCTGCGDELRLSEFLIHQHVSRCNLRPQLMMISNDDESKEYEWIIEKLIKPCVFSDVAEKRPTFDEIVNVFKNMKKMEVEEQREEDQNIEEKDLKKDHAIN